MQKCQIYNSSIEQFLENYTGELFMGSLSDPPYGLSFMGKEWDSGVPGKEIWHGIYNLLFPGSSLFAFGGTRTFHRLMVGIEDAGFDIRDTLLYIFGSGFPKSHNISKAIDDHLGEERQAVGTTGRNPNRFIEYKEQDGHKRNPTSELITAPSSKEAHDFNGYGTALKPAYEILICGTKPLHEKTEQGIILINLLKLEIKLCLLQLYANIVKNNIELNQASIKEELDFVQWNVEELVCIVGDLLDQTDMLQLELAINTTLNIVSSWKSIWEEGLKQGSMFITKTVTDQIIT